MTILRGNTLFLREGNYLRTDKLDIRSGGVLNNDGTLYTTTTVSSGKINGAGTLHAWWATSEFIFGIIDDRHVIVYYGDRPVESSWIQVMTGSIMIQAMINQWSLKD